MNLILVMAAGMLMGMGGDEKAPQKVVDLAEKTLAAFGTDPTIVRAVREDNAKGRTLDEIKAMDKEWMAASGINDFMKAMMNSECGKRLAEIEKSQPFFSELFLTNSLGANVAMTDKTSDYWQGDEAKFTDSWKEGTGAVAVGPVKFDDSSQTYSVHISVPVKDGDKVIGVLIFGVDVDRVP